MAGVLLAAARAHGISAAGAYTWVWLLVGIGTALGGVLAWQNRQRLTRLFSRSDGPQALAETLETVNALSKRVDFLNTEVERLTGELNQVKRERDSLRDLVTSRAAITDLTGAIDRLNEAEGRRHGELMTAVQGLVGALEGSANG